ncbi:hypothetical protein ACTQV6_11945 [Holdemanella porci]|uniref:hypothetical protein n=2 Tax=Holdemanella porci TaxID=2652276 RepID=UPI003F8E9836
MATQYLRITKLHDVRGRIDYISNPERQENLLAYRSTMDNKMWLALANQNQRSFKNNSRGVSANGKCIEAREIIFHLPHRFSANPERVLNQIVDDWKNTYHTDCAAALHWNHDKTNLHIHLIFSERERLDRDKVKYATRNMYYDADWKRCNKADAVHVIHKGEPTSPPFEHAKTRSFKSYTWLEQELKDHYAKILGLDRFERDGLHIPQQKTFKYQNREKAERIRENNQIIREFNEIVDYALSKHVLESDLKEIVEPLKDSVKRNKKNRTNTLKSALNELRRGVRQLTMTLEDIWNTIKSHHHTYTIAKYNARMCGYELDEQMENLKKTSMFSLHKEDRQNRKDIKQKIKDKKSEIDGYQEKADGSKKEIDAVLDEFPKIKPYYEHCKQIMDKYYDNGWFFEPPVYEFKSVEYSKKIYDLGITENYLNHKMTDSRFGYSYSRENELKTLILNTENKDVIVQSMIELVDKDPNLMLDDKLYERIKPIYSEFKIARIDLEDGNWLRQLSYEDKNGQMLDVKSLMHVIKRYQMNKYDEKCRKEEECKLKQKEIQKSINRELKINRGKKHKGRDIER